MRSVVAVGVEELVEVVCLITTLFVSPGVSSPAERVDRHVLDSLFGFRLDEYDLVLVVEVNSEQNDEEQDDECAIDEHNDVLLLAGVSL